jgi:high-affinity iron transporter
VLSNFLIGLREGLEASLVVGILVAYLVKTGNRRRLAPVWAGVGAAVGASIVVAVALSITSRSLSFEAQEAFGGIMSIIAVVFVTGMVFWMRSQSHKLKGEIQGKLADALAAGTAALALTAFLAVGREGLETALFVWAVGDGNGAGATFAAVAGIVVAAVAGWFVYRQSLHLNLARFFKITGVALIIVTAGVLAYGVHDLQEASILPGIGTLAFDVTRQIPPTSWYGTLLKGIFNFSPDATWLQVVMWVGYLVPAMFLFFGPVRRGPAPAPADVTPPSRTAALV